MTLSAQDAQAIAGVAQNLRVDPRVLGGLMELESGVNPNVWGGAGGQYRGLIQFGPGARKEVGLPERPMSIAEQMPYVQKYLQQRGFKPGVHGATELYRTVLVGNPGQSGTDSFGTNSDAAAKRMMPGGDLYKRFAVKFDGVAGSAGGSSAVPATATATLSQGGGLAEPDFSEILGLAGLGSSGATASLDPVSAAILAPLALTGDGGLRKAGGDAFLQALQTVGAAPDASSAVEPAATAAAASAPAASSSAVKEYLTGDPDHAGYRADHGGGNYHEHIAASSPEQARAMAKLLNDNGIKTTELKGVNTVGRHAANSYHYSGQAFDVPAAQVPVGQERELSRRVRNILKIA